MSDLKTLNIYLLGRVIRSNIGPGRGQTTDYRLQTRGQGRVMLCLSSWDHCSTASTALTHTHIKICIKTTWNILSIPWDSWEPLMYKSLILIKVDKMTDKIPEHCPAIEVFHKSHIGPWWQVAVLAPCSPPITCSWLITRSPQPCTHLTLTGPKCPPACHLAPTRWMSFQWRDWGVCAPVIGPIVVTRRKGVFRSI